MLVHSPSSCAKIAPIMETDNTKTAAGTHLVTTYEVVDLSPSNLNFIKSEEELEIETEEIQLTKNVVLEFNTLEGAMTTGVSLSDGEQFMDLMQINAYDRIAFKNQLTALCDRFNIRLEK